MSPQPIHPGLAVLALLAAVAAAAEKGERPKCGHEVRADREQQRADYLTECLASVRKQLLNLVSRPGRPDERQLLDLAGAIEKDLAHADELTRAPQYDAKTEAQAQARDQAMRDRGPEQVNAAEARPADPLAELPPDLRRGVLTTIHALGQLPLPPGAVATLTLSRTRQD